MYAQCRVTRLGEFSPIGRLFVLVRFFLMTEKARNFGLLSPKYVSILTKNMFGYILGDFITNSSGHPGPIPLVRAHCIKIFKTRKSFSLARI
jgi:hypothetical protein